MTPEDQNRLKHFSNMLATKELENNQDMF